MSKNLTESPPGFYADADYRSLLAQMGLDSVAAVFDFQQGQNLVKSNLAPWRHRIRFQMPNGQYVYLKRYDHPPKAVQIKAWFQHGQRAFLSSFDKGPAHVLRQVDVSIPKTIACGGQWQGLFERQSFIITLELENACSLETKLPACFHSDTPGSDKDRKKCIATLADFIRRFHQTGYRHRDLYLAHIFLADNGTLSLIDLHRCFRPAVLNQRYQIKDLAQLHYSCPGQTISRTDRIRFYRQYIQADKLTAVDKTCLRTIHRKAMQIARHDRKHGRTIPFETNAH